MLKQRYLLLSMILLAMLMSGCTAPTPVPTATATITPMPTDTATPPPTATETPVPTATFTPRPTDTNTPTATNSPSPTPSCNADQVLRDIKAHFPHDEFEVHYNSIEGTSSLVIWYVDPEINSNASGDEIETNAVGALQRAVKLSHLIAKENACLGSLFTAINPVVVDSYYNGWFSGQIDPGVLPDSEILSESELAAIEATLIVGYFRTNATVPAPTGPSASCTWIETREKLQQHFAPERENVSFYFVIDDMGVNVWAHWDGPTGFLATPSILNAATELDCLHPSPTQMIVIIVNDKGDVGLIGILPSAGIAELDLNQLQILYE